MGRGDRFQQPSFSVPMPATGAWPFPERERSYCAGCGRPDGFCECGATAQDKKEET